MKRRTVIKNGLAASALSLSGMPAFALRAGAGQSKAAAGGFVEKGQLKFWLEASSRRIYPNSPTGNESRLTLMAARNEQISFQACFRNLSTDSAIVKCELENASDFKTKIRRVGFVPMRQLNTYTPKSDLEGIGFIPGLCPDPHSIRRPICCLPGDRRSVRLNTVGGFC